MQHSIKHTSSTFVHGEKSIPQIKGGDYEYIEHLHSSNEGSEKRKFNQKANKSQVEVSLLNPVKK